MPIAAAVPAIISGGSSLLSGFLGGNAAKKAAQKQAETASIVSARDSQAAKNAQDAVSTAGGQAQEGIHVATDKANTGIDAGVDRQVGMYSPYTSTGADSLKNLSDLANGNAFTDKFSFNPSDLSSDPGFQFTQNEGLKALQRSAAAKGGLFSGGTLKGLASYATGSANSYFNDAFNRAKDTFTTNRDTATQRASTLAGLAGLGLNATGGASNAVGTGTTLKSANTINDAEYAGNTGLNAQLASGNFGLQGAQLAGSAAMGGANASAAGTVGATNAWNAQVPQLGKSLQDLIMVGLGQGGGSVNRNLPFSVPKSPYNPSADPWAMTP